MVKKLILLTVINWLKVLKAKTSRCAKENWEENSDRLQQRLPKEGLYKSNLTTASFRESIVNTKQAGIWLITLNVIHSCATARDSNTIPSSSALKQNL